MKTIKLSLLVSAIVACIDADVVNVAVGKATIQSGEKWPSKNAVDGKKHCPFINQTYYTLTDDSHLPWWQVDLGDLFRIEQINVYGRHDTIKSQLQGFQLFLSSNNFSTQSVPVYKNTAADYNDGTITITTIPPGLYRYVKLDLPDTFRSNVGDSTYKLKGPLVLCEVEVLADDVNTINIAPAVALRSSTVLSYNKLNFSEVNVIDENPAANPDECECCWSSTDELNPWLEAVLPYRTPVVSINVIGRNDKIDSARNLDGLKIQVDGSFVPDKWVLYNSTENTVTIYPHTPNANNVTFTRPRRTNSGTWFLIICEIKIITKALNIAPTVSLNRSSVLSYSTFNYSEVNVIDENTALSPDECDCCWSSTNEQKPWLEAVIPYNAQVLTINVFGRNDTLKTDIPRNLSGLKVQVDNTMVPDDKILYHTANNSVTIYPQTSTIKNIMFTRPKQPGSGREWFLIICEIEINRKDCSSGQYGPQCTSCGKCKLGAVCNFSTGICPNGCQPGYKGGKCDMTCEQGRFGDNCLSYCSIHCLNGVSQCDTVTGICNQGCAPGYMGTNCSKECADGKFGPGCNSICSSNCYNGEACTKTTGECLRGCDAGFTGLNCSTACMNGRYGRNCSSYCSTHCLNGLTQCNKATGICMQGCDAGYMGKNCSEACPDGKYGPNCNATCTNHCYNGTSQCNRTSGDCIQGCMSGYFGHNCSIECLDGTFGVNCTRPCHCMDGVACRKTDGFCKNGCALGWNGTDCSKDLNLIHRIREVVITKQSSIFLNDASYNSSKAIDGVQNNSVDTCHCCSVTNLTSRSWWQINLKHQYLIGSLEIFGRHTGANEQLENATIYAGNTSMEASVTAGEIVYNVPSMAHKRKFLYSLPTAIIGQYFIVQLLNNHLTLCEFRLLEKECDVGTFGYGCLHQCYCLDKKACNPVTGSCQTRGCLPGWQGEACDEVCDPRTFGDACNKTCNCIGGSPCVHTNGTCIKGKCDSGWLPPTCSEECNPHNFGEDCNNTCHCVDGSACNHISGICERGICEPGWMLPTCSEECLPRSFGDNCSSVCHCLDNTSCNAVFGDCDVGVCDPGWKSSRCDEVCDHGTFGYNCSSTCRCIDDTSCNATTGECDAGLCDPGWQGSNCSQVCDHRSFGSNCSSTCHCIENTNCDATTGECDTGLCDPGWNGSRCDRGCDPNWFGSKCLHKCHCNDNLGCSPINGSCTVGQCLTGWTGENCSIVMASLEEPQDSTGKVAGGVSGAVVLIALGVVIGFVIYKRKHSARKDSGNQSQFSHLDRALEKRSNIQQRSDQHAHVNRSFEDEAETSMNATGGGDYYSFGEQFIGIRIHELWDYIHEKMENECEKLFAEFKTLPQGLVHSYKSADNLANRGKNRYREMYAYDHTRVVLEDIIDSEDGKHTDYINACYIDGYEKVKKFVASQGPTKQMIDDFWRMVWQLKSDKIVMLTNLVELGTIKCMQYWPIEDEEDECTYGNVVIKVLDTEKYLDYNIRYLEVRKDGEASRRIRQFHFKSWPDKDVPDSTWCLVNFWRAVDTDAPSKAGPIVVHCSAGVGRTGTFIGLDNIVSQARNEGCVRPLQIVQTLRTQRVNMVQTREQYVYLHEAVADALLFGTHIIWTKQFQEMLTFMLQKAKGDTRSRLQIQLELIEKSVANSSSDVAESPEYSNVETLMSESDAYRPQLKNRGSKFVQQLGAIYIPNYKGKSTFLVSMSPDKGTMEEFWSLVDDSNIKTIIMLTEPSTTCYRASCELGSNANSGNRFSVNKIEEKIRKGYTERTYTFKESAREEEEYLTTVKQFEYTAWKDGYPVPGDTGSLLDLIVSVQRWQPHLSESQPVLIHCGDGCTRSGIVCVLLNELQRMKYEGGHINIVESVKMMKKRQSHLISNFEQYKFCYDLIMAHIQLSEVYQNL